MLQNLKRYISLTALLLTASLSFAQGKYIHIKEPIHEITGLAKIIASQTGFRYSLNMQNSSLRKRITLKPGNYTLNQILTQVKVQAKLSYKIVGTHIIFVDYVLKEDTKPIVQHHNTTKKNSTAIIKKSPPASLALLKNSDTLPAIDSTHFIFQAPALDSTIDSIKKDTNIIKPFAETDTIVPVQAPKLNAASKDSLYKISLKQEPKTNPAMPKERRQLLFAKAGFAVDEIFYANAVLEGGFNFLYGIVSYGTTFKAGGFRWGGGISLPLNEDNRLHLTFTTGNMRKTFDFDTFPQLLTLKETLHRFGAAWSKQVNDKVSIQVQLHYNLLLKGFTRNETANKPNPLFGDFDKQYYIIKPPYTLSKSIGETSVTKSWIGLQCTFFYRL